MGKTAHDENYALKVVLHAHPHFYRPSDKSGRLYKKLFPIPSLRDIVENAFENAIGICALSSCHTLTSGMDDRFFSYMSQAQYLTNDFNINYNKKEGWARFERNRKIRKDIEKMQLSSIIILHTQEVRTLYDGETADINVIGLEDLVPHSQDTEKTISDVSSNGGFSIVCHPSDVVDSLPLEKTIKLVKEEKVFFEEFNALSAGELNNQRYEESVLDGVKGISVSDAHHYQDTDISYILCNHNLLEDFSIKYLEEKLKKKDYEIFPKSMPLIKVFNYHILPILMSKFHL